MPREARALAAPWHLPDVDRDRCAGLESARERVDGQPFNGGCARLRSSAGIRS